MRTPFKTAFSISAYVVMAIMAIPYVTGQKDLVEAFSFAVLIGVPGWLVMGSILGTMLWLTCKPEKVKTEVITIRTTKLREDPPPPPVEPKKEPKLLDINYGGC